MNVNACLKSKILRSVLGSFALPALALSVACGEVVYASDNTTDWVRFHSFEYQGEDSLTQPVTVNANQYRNPVLAGFYPDPSLTRVGDDYYLVNSSFSWYPGVPIFHSRDLVSWKQIGHVLDRPEQLPLDGGRVSRGIFAPSIRFHDGVYYMITTNTTTLGNFYVTATNPAGPWSNPVALPEIQGIDPSFFFDDDGKAYIVHNGVAPDDKPLYEGHRAIYLFPFDVKTGKVSGAGKVVVNGGTDITKYPIWIEGPHIFKRNNHYYLIAAEGGTAEQHSEVVFRSRAVEGPYESFAGNPILTQRTLLSSRPDPITSTGHADFVETQNGEWWAVFLGCEPYADDQYNTGRQTFMLPVRWENDWPVVLSNGNVIARAVNKPKLKADTAGARPMTGPFKWSADFSGAKLPYELNTLRTPSSEWWRVDKQQHSLLLLPRSVDIDSSHDPSLVARRQQHAKFTSSVKVNLANSKGSRDAGLVVFQNETHNFFIGVHQTADGTRTVFLERRNGDVSQPASEVIPAGAKEITFKVSSTSTKYQFYYQLDGKTWKQLAEDQDGTILSTKKAGGFVGTYIGMFARTANVNSSQLH